MNENLLSVREIEQQDVELLVNYWTSAEPDYLKSMGVDLDKMPDQQQLVYLISAQLHHSYNEKQAYCIIWLIDGKPVGHSNVNKIVFGQEASMHLHFWNAENRHKGAGAQLVKMSLPYFFQNLQLKTLYCEPYSFNQAPNRMLEKVGFRMVKEYQTIPGALSFEQPVKRWELTYEAFKEL
ncbi:GNAT family N-acetyltransferase [Solitalea lacus]|uniref:GNAT family N-acetyltransferase n=1 Tax=Solitalea lacus TaxID=2911172 RepID=UPI001EDC51AB|nr:GNAT family protein [Solitalea lacus]UKJ06498.1 GNAT family N-acetyltransferase [Solitalea lacus]